MRVNKKSEKKIDWGHLNNALIESYIGCLGRLGRRYLVEGDVLLGLDLKVLKARIRPSITLALSDHYL